MKKMHTILITGANGQVGFELRQLTATYHWFNFILADRETLDITNQSELASFFNQYKIDTVINCAAYTAVDKAESEPQAAFAINSNAVLNLTEQCKRQSSNLIHISTDFVFDGTSNVPYEESATTNPLSVYGKSKLEGEIAALSYPHSLVIRTSWVYSEHGKNFVKTMLRLSKEKNELRVVNDQLGSPTYAADLADAVLRIITSSPKISQPEIFHYCNKGVITWYDFAKAILAYSHCNTPIIPIETTDYPTPAQRPKYSALNTNKIAARYSLSIPEWSNSLKNCLSRIHLK